MHKKTALHNRLVYGEKYISIEMLIWDQAMQM